MQLLQFATSCGASRQTLQLCSCGTKLANCCWSIRSWNIAVPNQRGLAHILPIASKRARIPSHVVELIDGICSEGYTEEAMDERYALKMPAKGTQAHETYAYEKEKLIQDAGRILPPYELGATELEETFNRLGQNPLLHNLWCWWGRPKSFPPWLRQFQR